MQPELDALLENKAALKLLNEEAIHPKTGILSTIAWHGRVKADIVLHHRCTGHGSNAAN